MLYYLAAGLSIACVIMFLTWLIYLLTENPSIVDVSWGLSILFVGLYYLMTKPLELSIYFVGGLLVLWGIRLSGYLWYTRVRIKEVDKRYEAMASDSQSKKMFFFFNFALQAFLSWLVASCFLFVMPVKEVSVLEVIGVSIVVVGILGESISDYQLYQFKKTSKEICKVGFWRYSRHPNYFFEILVWLGFGVFGVMHEFMPLSFLSFFSIIFIFFLTTRITEEVSLKKRGESFKKYQEETSRIIPWFCKK